MRIDHPVELHVQEKRRKARPRLPLVLEILDERPNGWLPEHGHRLNRKAYVRHRASRRCRGFRVPGRRDELEQDLFRDALVIDAPQEAALAGLHLCDVLHDRVGIHLGHLLEARLRAFRFTHRGRGDVRLLAVVWQNGDDLDGALGLAHDPRRCREDLRQLGEGDLLVDGRCARRLGEQLRREHRALRATLRRLPERCSSVRGAQEVLARDETRGLLVELLGEHGGGALVVEAARSPREVHPVVDLRAPQLDEHGQSGKPEILDGIDERVSARTMAERLQQVGVVSKRRENRSHDDAGAARERGDLARHVGCEIGRVRERMGKDDLQRQASARPRLVRDAQGLCFTVAKHARTEGAPPKRRRRVRRDEEVLRVRPREGESMRTRENVREEDDAVGLQDGRRERLGAPSVIGDAQGRPERFGRGVRRHLRRLKRFDCEEHRLALRARRVQALLHCVARRLRERDVHARPRPLRVRALERRGIPRSEIAAQIVGPDDHLISSR